MDDKSGSIKSPIDVGSNDLRYRDSPKELVDEPGMGFDKIEAVVSPKEMFSFGAR